MNRLYAETTRNLGSVVAESLTEDTVIEILSRLPIKSLMRFKCVSKLWWSLISDPSFGKLHLQRLKAGDVMPRQRIVKSSPLETIDYEVLDGNIGSYDDRTAVKFHEPRMDDPSWEPDLVGSCDGLVCLAVSGGFLLYNPTTRESRNLPGSDLVQDNELFHGFGYDLRSDDYKIVQGDGSKKCQVAIFSLKSHSWKRIQVQSVIHLEIYNQGVYWKGALHWCVICDRITKKETAIISFDLAEEKFHQISVPEADRNILSMGLGIHGANLFIYYCTYNGHFEAWTTNEYRRGGSWTILFSVSTEGIAGRELWQIAVAYTSSGKIVFQINAHKMILFNPEDNTYKDYCIKSKFRVKSAIYVETLVSPYIGCEPSRI